ncbi:MAG: hypothetical protein C4522_17005 [Desulfobacteraceae bacterium]|nr:MAG: hypothetical protein C4522_17005 [Desulfobacteraceae bacterium]
MALTVTVEIERELDADCSIADAFAYLADIPRSASNFPNIDKLIDLGKNTYQWEMKKFGVDKYSIQSIYAVKYTSNKSKGWIKWEPVEGIGNGIVEGSWKIKSNKDRTTHLTFYSKGELTLPLPGLIKRLVSPLVVREFSGLVDKYLKNLKKSLSSV